MTPISGSLIKSQDIFLALDESTAGCFEMFVDEMVKLSPSLFVKPTRSGKMCSLEARIPSGTAFITSSSSFFIKYEKDFKDSCNHLSRYLGSCTSSTTNNGPFLATFQNYKATVKCFRDTSQLGNGVFIVFFTCDQQIFIDYYSRKENPDFEYLTYLPYWVANAFRRIIECFLNYKKSLISPELIEKTQDFFIKQVENHCKMKLKFTHSPSDLVISYVIPFDQNTLSRGEDYFKDFLKFSGTKISYPLRELERVIGRYDIGNKSLPSFGFKIPNTKLKLEIDLSSYWLKDPTPPFYGGIKTSLYMMNWDEISELLDDRLENISKAISDMFHGYQELIYSYKKRLESRIEQW